jgi:hypothetical protein
VTGAHSVKAGYQGSRLDQTDQTLTNESLEGYTFNKGVPQSVLFTLPDFGHRTLTNLQGVYVQDSWTHNRLTLQGALRYDRASSYAPVEGNGTTKTSFLNPNPIAFPQVPGVDAYNDISPRMGAAYDLFGNGKTALKFNWGRYLAYAANDPPYTSKNPAFTYQTTESRNWTDADHDYVVDCDPLNFDANGECTAATGNNRNIGQANASAQVDPAVLSGWGVRPHDNQWTATVQQQILPRMSVDVAYTRRYFHGFLVTDDLSRQNLDANGNIVPGGARSFYDTYTLTAPSDPRLPGGGGYEITTYVPTATAAVTPSQQYITWDTTFGPERYSMWHGVDFTVNSRFKGITASFGTDTGRAVVDNCKTVINQNSPDPRNCHNAEPWSTTIRGLASYTIPKVDVLVSATVRSQNASQVTATWRVPNSVIADALGRLPVGSTKTGTTNITINDVNHIIYLDGRQNQVDMRFAKVLRFGRTRANIGVDLSNLLNANYPTSYLTTYTYGDANGGTWGAPNGIYQPRFIRLNFTLDF